MNIFGEFKIFLTGNASEEDFLISFTVPPEALNGSDNEKSIPYPVWFHQSLGYGALKYVYLDDMVATNTPKAQAMEESYQKNLLALKQRVINKGW